MFVRSAIKKDLLYFALPAILVWAAGLAFCAGDGFDGAGDLASTTGDIINRPGSLSVQVLVGFALIVIGFVILAREAKVPPGVAIFILPERSAVLLDAAVR